MRRMGNEEINAEANILADGCSAANAIANSVATSCVISEEKSLVKDAALQQLRGWHRIAAGKQKLHSKSSTEYSREVTNDAG